MSKLICYCLLGVGVIGCSFVVKPIYIEPETDLSLTLEEDFKQLKTKPSKKLVSQILSNAYTYQKRMDEKIKLNNKRALK